MRPLIGEPSNPIEVLARQLAGFHLLSSEVGPNPSPERARDWMLTLIDADMPLEDACEQVIASMPVTRRNANGQAEYALYRLMSVSMKAKGPREVEILEAIWDITGSHRDRLSRLTYHAHTDIFKNRQSNESDHPSPSIKAL